VKIPSSILAAIGGVLLTLISLWFGQHHGLLPEAASEEAPLVDQLFNAMMTISIGLFLLVQGILIYVMIRFRRREGDDTDGPPIAENLPLEILWTAIPVIIVMGIGVYSFEVYNNMGGLDPMASGDPGPKKIATQPGAAIAATLPDSEPEQLSLGVGASPDRENTSADLVVDVKGLQFAWIFTYPDSGVVSGELHVPAGRDVQLNITSDDVIHSFWVPQFRLKQDAIPGRDSQLRVRPQKTGEYPVICAELCGSYHGAMKTKVIVHEPEAFDEWLQSQIAANPSEQSDRAIAVNPQTLSESEFLEPYVRDMGIDADAISVLQGDR
jgi:cytochrome c oxidase subunit 2